MPTLSVYVWDLDPEGPENRADSFWDDVTSLLLQVGQLLRVHTPGDAGLQGRDDTLVHNLELSVFVKGQFHFLTTLSLFRFSVV